ncbi:ABC transporter ATP-binding protein [Bordetella genomosp. 10]|nr:oligopeptide/dipeptide ABC transporter ATP-binding protein [Bordetella genomosp. 10]
MNLDAIDSAGARKAAPSDAPAERGAVSVTTSGAMTDARPGMRPGAPLLRANAVTRDYKVGGGILQAVRGVDLDVYKGQTLGLVGESGCGKSTLAKLLLGMEAPTSGTVLVDGRPVSAYGRLERARLIQPVFQDPYSSLNPRMTAAAIIGATLEVRGERAGARARKVADIAHAVGLPPHLLNAYPSQLSGGQRQRVAIARALIGEPEILVCDEPTSALDVSVQSQILNLLSGLQRDFNLTMVLISHNLAVVHHLVDRVAVMYLGAVVEEGATADVFNAPRHPYTAALLGSVLAPTPGAGLPAIPLSGEFPSPLHPPPGCAFHPRCPRARETCARETPRMTGAAHRHACHFPLEEPHHDS